MTQVDAADIGWLAGFIDGEGSFSFGFNCSPSGRKVVHNRVCFVPQLGISNIKGEEWQAKLHRIYEALGVKHAFWEGHNTNYRGKPLVNCSVQRWTNIVKVCEAVEPYLTVKKKHAQAFIAFGPERPKLISRAFNANKKFQRVVDWDTANRLLDLVDLIRGMNGKKQNVRWTRELITQKLRELEGEEFPTTFITNNPRKRKVTP